MKNKRLNSCSIRWRQTLMPTVVFTLAFGSFNSIAAEGSKLELEEIIVTGTSSSSQTKLESSVAITTANADTLEREAPLGTADVLEIIPGFWVEDSGGEISNNVAPRGLSGGAAYSFIGLQEDGLPVVYSGAAFYADYILRQDVTIERLEAVRGGTSGILTLNGPGALVNFISAKGTEEPEGLVKATLTDYGTVRGDFLLRGPLNDDWLYSLGGFARTSDGIRETGFTTDRGGQVRLNLTRKLENGTLDLSFRRLDDHNTFFLPIPLQGDDDSIPGLDANSDTLIGSDNGSVLVRTPDGDFRRDLRDGFNTEGNFLGATLDLDFDNSWRLKNAFRYSDYDINTTGLFNFGNDTLRLASDRLNDQDVQDLLTRFAPDGAVAAEYRFSSTGETLTDLDNLNGNGLVTTGLHRRGFIGIQQFANDFRLTHETDRNSFSIGAIYFQVDGSRNDQDNALISEVRDQARRLDIVAVDDAGDVVGQLTDNGFITYGTGFSNGSYDVTSYSFYINDEFNVTDKLRIDAGVRYEQAEHRYNAELVELNQDLPGALDDDGNDVDNIVANNSIVNFGSGVFRAFEEDFDEVAWTTGFNYAFNDSLAIYGRYADSFQMPLDGDAIGSIGFGRVESATDAELISRIGEPTGLKLTEIGVRYHGETLGLSATLFRTVFEDLRLTIEGTEGGFDQVTIETETTGIEFEAVWQPTDYFQLEVAGVVQEAEIDGIPSASPDSRFNGNQIARTPETQIRVIPTFYVGGAELFLMAHHIGKRFADVGNSVELPSYTTFDAGFSYNFTESLSFQFKGSNLTDEVGLTEGNPRGGFTESVGGDFFYARPIFGRNFTASLTYRF